MTPVTFDSFRDTYLVLAGLVLIMKKRSNMTPVTFDTFRDTYLPAFMLFDNIEDTCLTFLIEGVSFFRQLFLYIEFLRRLDRKTFA